MWVVRGFNGGFHIGFFNCINALVHFIIKHPIALQFKTHQAPLNIFNPKKYGIAIFLHGMCMIYDAFRIYVHTNALKFTTH